MDGIRKIGGEVPELDAGRTAATRPGGGQPFAEALGHAMAQVEALQQAGDQQANLAANGAGNLHELALSLEKADVAIRAAAKIRNKLVDAYQEIMRMPV